MNGYGSVLRAIYPVYALLDTGKMQWFLVSRELITN